MLPERSVLRIALAVWNLRNIRVVRNSLNGKVHFLLPTEETLSGCLWPMRSFLLLLEYSLDGA